jgi:nicotinic acid mononucleotide adenylyltransferase
MDTENIFGVYVWRLNPMHLWHQYVIDTMIAETKKNCLLVLWSANTPCDTDRHLFSLQERSQIVSTLYPELPLVWIPDFGHIPSRLFALDQIVALKRQWSKEQIVYYGWSKEDTKRFTERWDIVRIIDRVSGISPVVSATDVRNALRAWTSLDGLVDERVEWLMRELYEKKK